MKEIDDTEIQVEADFADLLNTVAGIMFEIDRMNKNIQILERNLRLRLANLEARKPPQDTNQDAEWY